MQELKSEDIAQRERLFKNAYDKFKMNARQVHLKLNGECNDEELTVMMDKTEELMGEIHSAYERLRLLATPPRVMQINVDTSTVVTTDIMQLLTKRMEEQGTEWDEQAERGRLHLVFDKEYAKSIFGSIASVNTVRPTPPSQDQTVIEAQKTEYEAELAAKRATVGMDSVIAAQRVHIKRLQDDTELEALAKELEHKRQ